MAKQQTLNLKEQESLELLKKIARIPSPTGFEVKKATYIKDLLKSIGIKKIFIDDENNCIAEINSYIKTKKKKNILFAAHIDTACKIDKEETPLKEDANFIYGHGVCDNSAGVVGLISALKSIKEQKIQFPNNIIVAFTAGEEGLGGKRGMRKAIKTYWGTIDAVVNIESHNIGRATHRVIGQYRTNIVINTKEGGHSFRDFGKPNAIVILSQLISDFSRLEFSQKNGKTTYNIGKISGGEGINAIAKEASALFEVRSENKDSLTQIKNQFKSLLQKLRKEYSNVEITNTILAEVNPAYLSPDHKLCQMIKKTQKSLGITTKFDSGNTDGDVSLALGIPTITIGTSIGYKTHSLEEYIEKKSLALGIKQAFSVIKAVASEY